MAFLVIYIYINIITYLKDSTIQKNFKIAVLSDKTV